MNLWPCALYALPCISFPAVHASELARFNDQARVISSEPVYETSKKRMPRQPECEPVAPVSTLRPVDQAMIGEDMLEQERLWRFARECDRDLHPYEKSKHSGYWVTYRYAGRNVSRFFPYDPGEWVPVTVDLTPMP